MHGCENDEKPANDGDLHGCTDKNSQTGHAHGSGQGNGGNGTAKLRSDIEGACEKLSGGSPTPPSTSRGPISDYDAAIEELRERGEPVDHLTTKECIPDDDDDVRHLTICAKSDLQVLHDELWLREGRLPRLTKLSS